MEYKIFEIFIALLISKTITHSNLIHNNKYKINTFNRKTILSFLKHYK